MASTTFKTLTLNVQSLPLMSRAQVRHDINRASHQASLIGWQEIDKRADYRGDIRHLPAFWDHYLPHDGGLKIPNPISWDHRLRDIKG